jgi:hypothetical protein
MRERLSTRNARRFMIEIHGMRICVAQQFYADTDHFSDGPFGVLGVVDQCTGALK